MRPISRIFAGCALIAALAIPSIAADDFGTVLGNIGKDAAKDYMAPGVTWFGAGMNAGWYNSSKSLSMFKLPVGISVLSINEPFVVIDEDMRNFDFNGKIPAKMIMDPDGEKHGRTRHHLGTIIESTAPWTERATKRKSQKHSLFRSKSAYNFRDRFSKNNNSQRVFKGFG